MTNTKEIIFSLALFIIVCTTWYFGWVKTNDAFLASMMDCMERNGDGSEQGYRDCVLEFHHENR